jgi:hypothetical protein
VALYLHLHFLAFELPIVPNKSTPMLMAVNEQLNHSRVIGKLKKRAIAIKLKWMLSEVVTRKLLLSLDQLASTSSDAAYFNAAGP